MKHHAFFRTISLILALTVLAACAFSLSFSAETADSEAAQKQLLSKEHISPASVSASDDADDMTSVVEGEAIVVMEDGADASSLSSLVEVEDTITISGKTDSDTLALVSLDGATPEEIETKLENKNGIRCVLPNNVMKISGVTSDPYSDFQWALNNTGQNNGVSDIDIQPDDLWNNVSKKSNECVVAMLDTGIDQTHEDLKPVLWKNTYSSLSGYGQCGYDFTDTFSNHQPNDDHGHGTHCAGIIAAQGDNNRGISGVNRSKVKIMALKVGNKEGTISDANVFRAFEYVSKAKKLGVNVRAVNCSFGGRNESLASKKEYERLINLLGEQGIVTCVAAGNEKQDVSGKTSEGYYVPAGCDSKYCLSVAATGEDGSLASYSNYSSTKVDIAAPGSDILSTVSYYHFLPTVYSDQQRKSLCADYQGYDTAPTEKDFGATFQKPNKTVNNNISYTFSSDYYCGTSGGALMVTLSNPSGSSSSRLFGFELPYTLSSTTGNYIVSSMIKRLSGSCKITIYDIPQGSSITSITPQDYYYPDECFDQLALELSPGSTSGYIKNTNRRLGFLIESYSKTTTLLFDDLAISKQNYTWSDFGDYEFMDGTSMSTPFVCGAVALASNAFPTASAAEVIRAIKASATKRDALKPYVENGNALDLSTLASLIKVPAGSIKLDRSSATLLVGETLTLSASVSPADTSDKTVTFSSSDAHVATVSNAGVVAAKGLGVATITAKTANGKTASCTVTVKNEQGYYANAPTITKIVNTGAGQKITIQPVSGATSYRLFVKGGRYGDNWTRLSTSTATERDGVTDAVPTERYTYTVRCVDKDGSYISDFDRTGVSLTFVEVAQPKALTNTTSGVKFTWYKSKGAASFRLFVRYRASTDNVMSAWKTLTDTNAAYTYTAAKSGCQYEFTARPLDNNGKYLNTVYKTKTITFISAPAAPTLKNTSSGVQVSWKKPTGAKNFRVFRKTNGGKWTKLGDTTSTSFLDKKAKNGVKYTYTIRCLSKDVKKYISAYLESGASITCKR